MDFDSIRLELEALEEKLNTLKNAIKVEEKKQKVEELEKETFKDGFWDNMKESSKIADADERQQYALLPGL